MWRRLKDLWREPTDAPSDLTARVHALAAAWGVADEIAWHVTRRYAHLHGISVSEAALDLSSLGYADALREIGEA